MSDWRTELTAEKCLEKLEKLTKESPATYCRGEITSVMAYLLFCIKCDEENKAISQPVKTERLIDLSGWKPINTAPKTGMNILLLISKHKAPIVERYIKLPLDSEGQARPAWASSCENCLYSETEIYPTHWMPLPEDPE